MSNGVVRVPRLKEAIKSGWLEHLIREGWLRKRWRNRWCVLHRGMLYLFENQVKDDSDKPSSTISLDSYQAAKTANKKDTKKGQPTLELTPKLQNGKKDAKKALFSAENQEELDKWEEAIVKAMQKEKKPAEPGAPLEHVTKTRARPQANKRRPPSRDHLRGKRITTASTGIDLDISMETPTTENSSPAAAKKRGNRPTQAMRPNRARVPSGGEVLAPSGGEVLAPSGGEVLAPSGGDDTNAQLNGSTSHGESPPPSSANDASEEETTNDERPPIAPSPAHKPPTEGEAPPPPSVDDVFTPEVTADEQETRNDDVISINHNKSPPPPPSPACKPKFTPTTTTTDDVTTDDDDDVTTDDDVVDRQKPPPLPSPARKPLMDVKEEEEEEEEEDDEDGASFTDDELDEVDVDHVVDGDVIDDVETLNVNNCNSKSIPTSDEEDALPPNPNDLMELPSEVRDALDVLDEQLLDVSTSDDDDDDDDTEDDELAHNNITKTAMVDAR